jgi:hypothetical protein
MALKEIRFTRQGAGYDAVYKAHYQDSQGFTETEIELDDGDTWILKDGDEWTTEETGALATMGLGIRLIIETEEVPEDQ